MIGVLDTNVLLRVGLLEFLFDVHSNGAYVARWSRSILLELEEHLPRRGPRVSGRVLGLLAEVPDGELPVSPGDHAAAVGACDLEDEHVLATALCARRVEPYADVTLVTGNLKDFDVGAARQRDVKVLDPDAFGLLLLERDPVPVLRAVQRQPGHRFDRFLQEMRRDGLPKTADGIHQWFKEMESG